MAQHWFCFALHQTLPTHIHIWFQLPFHRIKHNLVFQYSLFICIQSQSTLLRQQLQHHTFPISICITDCTTDHKIETQEIFKGASQHPTRVRYHLRRQITAIVTGQTCRQQIVLSSVTNVFLYGILRLLYRLCFYLLPDGFAN